jgi:hypothetical protein
MKETRLVAFKCEDIFFVCYLGRLVSKFKDKSCKALELYSTFLRSTVDDSQAVSLVLQL